MSHFVQFNTKQNRSSFIVLRVKWLIAVFHETNLTKYQKRLNKMTHIKSLLSFPSVSALHPVSIRGHGVKPWPAGGRGPWQEVVSPCQRLVARRQRKLRWPRHRQLPLGRRQVQTAPEDRFNQISSAHHSSDSPVWSPTCFCSGPPGLKLEGVDQAVATATGLQVGRYTFRLTVCDQEGATDSAALTVQVQEGEAASLHELFCTSTKHSVLFSDILWTKQLINNEILFVYNL